MKREVGSSVLAVALAALAVACGTLLANSGDDDAPSADGGGADVPAADGGQPTNVPVPQSPPLCPLAECPDEVCKDEDCDDADRDFDPKGGTFTRDDATGSCTLSTDGEPSVMSYVQTKGRTTARTYAVLGLEVLELTADAAIAKLSIEGAPADSERIVLRRESGAYRVCEENVNGTRCSEPLDVTPPQRLYVFGTVTSENPPRAAFALGTDANGCSAQETVELTAPFPEGDIRVEVGCLDDGGACTLRFDNAITFERPE